MTEPLTKAEIAEMRARCEAATPGPWTDVRPGRDAETGFSKGVIVAAVAPRQGIYADPPGGSYPAADQSFIAHARTDLPRLLDELERMREALREIAHECDPTDPPWANHEVGRLYIGSLARAVLPQEEPRT